MVDSIKIVRIFFKANILTRQRMKSTGGIHYINDGCI